MQPKHINIIIRNRCTKQNIGGEYFNNFREINIAEIIQDEYVNDRDTTNYTTDPIYVQKISNSMTENNMHARLQLSANWKCILLQSNFEKKL